MSLVPAEQPILVWLVLAGCAGLGLVIDRTPLARIMPGVIIAILLAMVLANVGVLPDAPLVPGFDVTNGLVLTLAIPLLLMKVHVIRALKEAGRMSLVFGLAVVASVMGGLAAFALLPLGENAAALAGGMTAATIGGSPNFLAVAQVTEILDDPRIAPMGAAALLVAVVYMILLAILPEIPWLRRLYPQRAEVRGEGPESEEQAAGKGLKWLPLAGAVALSVLLGAISIAATTALGAPQWALLVVTALTLVAAAGLHGPLSRVRGEFTLGLFAMYLVFSANGMRADFAVIAAGSVDIVGLGLIVIAVHFAVIMVLGRIFRFDLAEIVTASNAAVLAAPTAAALAAAKGWRGLIVPGTLVGMLGYAVATFAGTGLAWLLSLL